MAGNSRRRGAVRAPGSKKGPISGSGGRSRRGLEGRGPTPPAERRPGHPAARRARSAGTTRTARPEVILGRNAVDEALRAGIPAVELAVLDTGQDDVRVRRAKQAAASAGLPIMPRTRPELDRLADGLPHQGVALVVAPFRYADLGETLAGPGSAGRPSNGGKTAAPIVVVLDHIQDPRNLGAIARSAAAFAARALVIPNRRSASVTAAAWRTSAGALARIPVCTVVNLARTLGQMRRDGFLVIGLASQGGTAPASLDRNLLDQPVALVIGSESDGLSRLVAEQCDIVTTIPIGSDTESLNASVAAGIALYLLRHPLEVE